jgi:hypothetical protein
MINQFSTRLPRSYNRKRIIFSKIGSETTRYPHKKSEIGLPTSHHTKKGPNSKWVKDLNVRD